MKFKNLSEEEFIKFSSRHEQLSFYQTIEWAELKKSTGWKYYLLGVEEKNKIVAAAMILSKKLVLSKTIMYAPRAFLMDYKNKKLLDFFTEELKKFLKTKGAIFLKIDPNLMHLERDIDGQIVEKGTNNSDVVEHLIQLGYRHFGFNLYQETMQPRWMFAINIKNKTYGDVLANYNQSTRRIVNKNEKIGIKTRELPYEELDKFKDIMQSTGDRRQFIDRPLSYYQNMYKAFENSSKLKIVIAELHCKDAIKYYENEITNLINERNLKIEQFSKNPHPSHEKKHYKAIKESQDLENRLKDDIAKTKLLQKEAGNIIPLSTVMFFFNKKEAVALIGGTYKKYMNYQAIYTILSNEIKEAIDKKCELYNFYGITGDFNKTNPLIGLYTFKKGFGGNVLELIGEFDLVINKTWFALYTLSFKSLRFLKNLKTKIKK